MSSEDVAQNPAHERRDSQSCGIYRGVIRHRRTRPREHAMRYRVFSLLLDLDRIDSLASSICGFSRNRPGLVSFHDRDFGDPSFPEESLKEGVHRRLADAGLPADPHRILLSCTPRVFGYTFNPLSLYYCQDVNERVYAVVYEVHNTFGERHAYVLAADRSVEQAGDASDDWIESRCDKALFVSPFAHMDMHYAFRLNDPGQRQVIVIRASDADGPVITASYTARREALTSRNLIACVARMPLLTYKIIVGIHFEALRLWFKRVPWHRHVPADHSA